MGKQTLATGTNRSELNGAGGKRKHGGEDGSRVGGRHRVRKQAPPCV